MRFDISDLRLFLAVVNSGSITHGADRVNLSLAATSGRIKQMEDTLGVPLLERHRHGVTPTDAGDCLAKNARIILRHADRMRMELIPFSQGLSGSLRILTNTAALHEHLPGRLASFLAGQPGINIETRELRSTDIAAELMAGRGEIGIAAEADLPEGLERSFFAEDRLVVVMPKGSATRVPGVRFADIVSKTFVGLSRNSPLQQLVASQAERLGEPMTIRARVSDFHAMAQMVDAGVGVGIMPETSAKRCAHPFELPWSVLRDKWATRRLMLCVAPDAAMSKMSRLLLAHLCGSS